MSFTLLLNSRTWRQHIDSVNDSVSAHAEMVPVIKGNGYGLGQHRLAHETARLGSTCVAVGTVYELADILDVFAGDVVVLEPFEPRDAAAAHLWARMLERPDAQRVIRTIARPSALQALTQAVTSTRVLIEARSSMQRFGMDEREVIATLADGSVRSAIAEGRLEVAGLTLHLPLVQPADEASGRGPHLSARVREVCRWTGLWLAEISEWTRQSESAAAIWTSHLGDAELAAVEVAAPGATLRARVGTRLWLGERSALTAQGTVLAVHPLPRGTHVGYRQRTGPRDGTLVVVSGGTGHGIGLSAPTPASSTRQRVVTAGTGALEAVGKAMSPFAWAGSRRWFAEPPHQHHSMIWLPRGCVIPAVGDQMTAEIRFTTTRFDAVIES
ncbi:MAG: alanine racemase [Actinobacteria bacterium]|nr:alanine racemase [Actinomycetota bacterium]